MKSPEGITLADVLPCGCVIIKGCCVHTEADHRLCRESEDAMSELKPTRTDITGSVTLGELIVALSKIVDEIRDGEASEYLADKLDYAARVVREKARTP